MKRAFVNGLVVLSLAVQISCVATIQPNRNADSTKSPTVGRDWCPEGAICVLVEDAREPHDALQGARVFILGEEGDEIASAVTDEFGQATFPPPDPAHMPRYVLVEAEGYFIGGERWRDGAREYYILLTIGTLR